MGTLTKKLQNIKEELEKADQIAKKLPQQDVPLSFTVSLDLMSITGTDGYFKLVNKSFADALKYKIEEVVNRSWLSFIHPDDIEKTLEFSKFVRNGNIGKDFINRYADKNGDYITLSWTCKQIPDGTIFSSIKIVK